MPNSNNIPDRPFMEEDTRQYVSPFEHRKMAEGGKMPARVQPVPEKRPLPLPPQVEQENIFTGEEDLVCSDWLWVLAKKGLTEAKFE